VLIGPGIRRLSYVEFLFSLAHSPFIGAEFGTNRSALR
jgi:hypothetical protein